MTNTKIIRIEDVRKQLIIPFEYEDQSLYKLFSYFLYSAPSINSASATKVDTKYLDIMWESFISKWEDKRLPYKIYSQHSTFPKEVILEKKYKLSDASIINKNSRAFLCFKKNSNEHAMESLLRTIRNAIAHGRVHILKKGNRQYILLEDYNSKKNKRGMILFSKSDLQDLKRITSKYSM